MSRGASSALNARSLGAVMAAAATAGLVVANYRFGILASAVAVGMGVFVGLVILFRRAPQIGAVIIIAGIAVQPMAEFFISSSIGPIKDAAALAALVALAWSAVAGYPPQRRDFDAWLVTPVVGLMALYLIDPAGSHNAAWQDETRLVVEALGLLLVGYLNPDPRRTWRWALGALVVAGLLNVFLGAIQQAIGPDRLIRSFGYAYGSQVRETASGQFRSFGTFDDPFSYAELLIVALAAVCVSGRRSWRGAVVACALALGIAMSFVRTELVLLIPIAVLTLLRMRRTASAAAVLLASVIAIIGFVGLTSFSDPAPSTGSTRTSFLLSVNGRSTGWAEVLGAPASLIAGRGVGTVGEGLTRSAISGIVQTAHFQPGQSVAKQRVGDLAYVDSTYLTDVAEVGLPGLALLLFAFSRILRTAWLTAGRDSSAGWSALAMFVVIAIDGITRSAVLGFPFGFIAMYAIGTALAAAETDARQRSLPGRVNRLASECRWGFRADRTAGRRPPAQQSGRSGHAD